MNQWQRPSPAARPRPVRAAGGLLRHLRLAVFLGGVSLHRLTEYRADFLLGAASVLVRVGLQVLVVALVFRHVPSVGGWGYHEALFLLGFSLLPRGLDRLFTDQLWELGRKLVQRGEFYRYLIRPVNPLFALLSERFLLPDGLGELATGLLVTGYAAWRLDLEASPATLLLGAALVVCGAVIHASIKLLLASLALWTTTSLPAMYAANQLADFAGYPLDIYAPPLRGLLTWVLPFAFTSYVPAVYLLHGTTTLLVWTPVVTAVTALIALQVWRRGLNAYEMTGS
ncbi:ABC transporter permease [Allostreptomyces psammosilenae]|uniref:ABC-2 type transport system permease protein n=1 Tax=Allostreptomyces psammosilenae TaxID=1892865 RepID=A0A852ZP97_9ACTN|nr:ABC-2 family transporter protein [Allostreptomyces psammosilenae]NYI04213.1 ABC-2 type transport system permease protein [Allostreptomyces psammosilenae]